MPFRAASAVEDRQTYRRERGHGVRYPPVPLGPDTPLQPIFRCGSPPEPLYDDVGQQLRLTLQVPGLETRSK